MREIISHKPGKIFLLLLLATILVMFYMPKFFFKPHLVFGFLPLPFVAGIVFLLVWLVAYLVYFFQYWPFRR